MHVTFWGWTATQCDDRPTHVTFWEAQHRTMTGLRTLLSGGKQQTHYDDRPMHVTFWGRTTNTMQWYARHALRAKNTHSTMVYSFWVKNTHNLINARYVLRVETHTIRTLGSGEKKHTTQWYAHYLQWVKKQTNNRVICTLRSVGKNHKTT